MFCAVAVLIVDTSICATSRGVLVVGARTLRCATAFVAALNQVRLLRLRLLRNVWHGLLQRFASAELNRVGRVG
jgi:hypothetical protein